MAKIDPIEIEVKSTAVKRVALLICKLKSKWLLRRILDLTVAKVYANGKLISKVTLREYLPEF